MYSILIADDEPLQRLTVRRMIVVNAMLDLRISCKQQAGNCLFEFEGAFR